MEAKHYEFLTICAFFFVIGVVLAKRYPQVRDWLFGLGVYMTVDLDRYDINLDGRAFYRAATRGFELSIVDVISAILIFSASRGERRARPPTYVLIVTYTAYAALTVLLNDPKIFGAFELTKILRGLFAFTAAARYVSGPRQLRVLMIALTATIGYEGAQSLFMRYVGHVHRVGGTLNHPNNLAVFSNVAAPILLTAAFADYAPTLKKAFAFGYALCGACVVLTISRTGFAVFMMISALIFFTLVRIRLTPRQIATLAALGLVGLGAVYRAKDSLTARYESASLSKEATSDKGRGLYFRLGAAVFADRPFGVGLNNWSWVVTNEYYEKFGLPFRPYENTDVDFSSYTKMEAVQMVAPPAHNLWILTLGEVGIIGFGLFVAIWVRWMVIARRFVRRSAGDIVSRYGAGVFFALLGLTLSTMTEYAYRHAQIFFFVHMLVGGMMGLTMGRNRAAARQRALLRRERQALDPARARVLYQPARG